MVDGETLRAAGAAGVLLQMPSTANGTARVKIWASEAVSSVDGRLDKEIAGRLLRGFFDLMYK
jgi:hypothetical protein